MNGYRWIDGRMDEYGFREREIIGYAVVLCVVDNNYVKSIIFMVVMVNVCQSNLISVLFLCALRFWDFCSLLNT